MRGLGEERGAVTNSVANGVFSLVLQIIRIAGRLISSYLPDSVLVPVETPQEPEISERVPTAQSYYMYGADGRIG
jgi:hypothetical protein